MNKLISQCPFCHSEFTVSSLRCNACGIELKGEYALSVFDRLPEKQYDFLISFLKNRGNLKDLQNELNISYPTAKKMLDELLTSLELNDGNSVAETQYEVSDMKNVQIDHTSTKASEIVKAKLKECGGHTIVHTARGLPCDIYANPDGCSFTSNKLPIKPPYEYEVFDVIVDLLLSHNGHARKGNGRNFKLGEPNCDEHTVVGAVAKNYSGKRDGESVFDPVFVLAAVLEWAGIANNERGELVLTQTYKNML